MNEFVRCYKGEMYKISRKHTFIKVIIAMVVMTLLLLVVYSFADNLLQGLGLDSGLSTSFGNNDDAIDHYTKQLDYINNQINSGEIKNNNATKKQLNIIKGNIAKYEYLKKIGKNDTYYDNIGEISTFNAGSFTIGAIGTISQIVVIFAIVMSAKNLSQERGNGTLKMQLIRPNARQKVFSAKHISVFTSSVALLIVGVIIAQIIGVIAFPLSTKSYIAVMDSSVAFVISPFGLITLMIAFGIIEIFSFIQLTYFLSMFAKGRNTSLIIALLVYLLGDVLDNILSYMYLGFFGYKSNLAFLSAFTNGGTLMPQMKLWSMLLISTIYIVLMTVFNYKVFEKQDIN